MRKATGRSLGDFRSFFRLRKILPAEQKLLNACAEGKFPQISRSRPKEKTSDNLVRADFLRFLLLGGDENAPVHEQGVQLRGAWIEGLPDSEGKLLPLDLEGAILPHDIALNNCRINCKIALIAARTRRIDLSGSKINEFSGDGAEIKGDLFLRAQIADRDSDFARFMAEGSVKLAGAKIDGDLDCSGGLFKNTGVSALAFDRAEINGGVFLREKFVAYGSVHLIGAKITGDFDCRRGIFRTPRKVGNTGPVAVLSFDRAEVLGMVELSEGFVAHGLVRLHDATIAHYLDCRRGTFIGGPMKELSAKGDNSRIALSMNRARVAGRFFIRELTKVSGNISLAHTHVGALFDDEHRPHPYKNEQNKWQESYFYLDGFTYDSLHTGAPVKWKIRLAWLTSQPPKLLHDEFRPQPWEQLIKILRETGHKGQAARIAIAKEKHLRHKKTGKIKFYVRPFHFLFGALAGYGHTPSRLIISMFAVWIVCGVFYYWAASEALFGPSNPLVFNNPNLAHCAPNRPNGTKPKIGNWWICPDLPGEYTSFSPLVYSLELILPVVSLGQARDWGPITPSATDRDNGTRSIVVSMLLDMVRYPAALVMGWPCSPSAWRDEMGLFVRFVTWLENLFGWAASLIMVATLSGLVKKDDK